MTNIKDVLIGVCAIIVYVVVCAVVMALPVMLLWNLVMPDIFNVPVIDFWHALGLSLLCGCLFGIGKSSKKN